MDEASGSPILITELPEGQRRKRLAYRLYLCAQALLAMEREQSRGLPPRRDCADETRIPLKAKGCRFESYLRSHKYHKIQ
jgi:hypothetical protein